MDIYYPDICLGGIAGVSAEIGTQDLQKYEARALPLRRLARLFANVAILP
jgi:hypothetical protein